MITELLEKRRLPELLTMNDGSRVRTPDQWRMRRNELLDLLKHEIYGYTPAAPAEVRGEVLSSTPAYAGKAVQSAVRLSFDTPGGTFSFPITLVIPNSEKPVPVFVNIAFRPEVPDRYLPAEEIVDHGFAVATFFYKDVTDDSDAFDGIAPLYPRDPETGWGTIGMWAFAASRVLDYLESREEIDCTRACVCGHSRLGKTALWCGAQDERFSMVVSNNSGSSGAAIARGKIGENVERITAVFPFWFCGNYRNWSSREDEMPFDQHMLLALVAPRKLYVNSAVEDEWADPLSEFLSCAAANEAWKVLRMPGLISPDALPVPGSTLMDGNVCYHLRSGAHFFSRADWQLQMACRERYHI